jgi:hemerythrin
MYFTEITFLVIEEHSQQHSSFGKEVKKMSMPNLISHHS